MIVSPNVSTISRRVRSGDLWQLRSHRLLCGDCTEANAVLRLMQGERARLTITSPPYNLGKNARLAYTPTPSKYAGHSDHLSPANWLTLLTRSVNNALAISDIVIVDVQMLAGNKVALLEWLYGFREQVIDVVIWDKGCGAPAQAHNVLTSRFEFLWFLTSRRSKGKTPRTLFTADFRGTVSNVYAAPPRRGQRLLPRPCRHVPHSPAAVADADFRQQSRSRLRSLSRHRNHSDRGRKIGADVLGHGDRAGVLRPHPAAMGAGDGAGGAAHPFPAYLNIITTLAHRSHS